MAIESLFGKVKDSLERGVEAVSAKSNEIVEVTRLKGANAMLQDEMNGLKVQLGNACLLRWKAGELEDDAFASLCMEIAEKEREIEENVHKIEAIKMAAERMNQQNESGILCGCGKVNRPGAKFCVNCGCALSGKEPEMKTCECGAAVKAEAKFCPKCGASFFGEES